MGVPVRPGAGLERDVHPQDPRRIRGLEQRVDPDHSREVLGGSLARRLGTTALDLHPASFVSGCSSASRVISIIVRRKLTLAKSPCAGSFRSAVERTTRGG